MILFAYGTLMNEGVFKRVINRKWDGNNIAGKVLGWKRINVGIWMAFPEIGTETYGITYDYLSDTDFLKLDEYEGVKLGYFKRASVGVLMPNGSIVDAQMYHNGPAFTLEKK